MSFKPTWPGKLDFIFRPKPQVAGDKRKREEDDQEQLVWWNEDGEIVRLKRTARDT